MDNKVIFSIKNKSFTFDHQIIKCENKDEFFIHTHAFPELFYIKQITGSHIIEDKEYNLKEEDLLIIPATVHHRMNPKIGTIYERYDFCFDPKILDKINAKKFYTNITAINCSNHKIITEIFKKLDYYSKELNKEDFEMISKNLIREVFINLSLYSKNDFVEPEFLNPILSKALNFINENLYTMKSVSEISDYLYITDSYLYKIFQKQFKTSPKKYIITKKMYIAKKEISAGAKPTEIYSKLGFTDYPTFYKNYINHFGHSPSKEHSLNFKDLKS